jgi:hypothetical protein
LDNLFFAVTLNYEGDRFAKLKLCYPISLRLMPAKDIYHATVIQALIADGWTITDDSFHIAYGGRELYIDIGAQKVTIAAERGNKKIAVEIKSFLNPSPVSDLQEAVGYYEIYRTVLK